MIAYKFLGAGGVGPFSGFAWPLPRGRAAGPWVEATPSLCSSGIHACLVSDLPYWLNSELWEVELDDPVRSTRKLVAGRGRLLRRVEAWNRDAMCAFAASCAERTAALADGSDALAGYSADTAVFAARGQASAAAFVSARAAETAGGPIAYDAERERQARWLANRLGLCT